MNASITTTTGSIGKYRSRQKPVAASGHATIVGLFVAAALAATSLQAKVYAPTLGPQLDPTLTFTPTSSAFTYSGGAGVATLSKMAGVGLGDGAIKSSFTASGDFMEQLTFDDSGLGLVGLELYAAETGGGRAVTDIFYDGPNQFESYIFDGAGALAHFSDVGGAANPVTFEITRTGSTFATFLDGVEVASAQIAPVTVPFTFGIVECAGDCISAQDAGARSTTITSFTVTTPGVPEPATWGMLLLGFAASGAAMRSRRAPAARA